MKDAAYSVAVNGYNRTDRGLSTLPSAGLAERRPKAYAQPTEPPLASKAASAGVYDDDTSRWTDCIQSVGSYFLDRLDISFCLCPLSFLIVRSLPS